MKKLAWALALACALPLSAHAQLMDMFKNAISNAAVNTVVDKGKQAITGAASSASAPAPAPAQTAAAAAVPSAAPAAAAACGNVRGAKISVGPRPWDYEPEALWPENTDCPVASFADFKFDAARAQLRQFDNASKVRCSDCEGGYAFDGWVRHYLKDGMDDKKFTAQMIGLTEGKELSWKGKMYRGAIKLTGEHPIGDFPCKQYHWTLTDKNNKVVAERDGLYCEYKGDYATTASWHQVL